MTISAPLSVTMDTEEVSPVPGAVEVPVGPPGKHLKRPVSQRRAAALCGMCVMLVAGLAAVVVWEAVTISRITQTHVISIDRLHAHETCGRSSSDSAFQGALRCCAFCMAAPAVLLHRLPPRQCTHAHSDILTY